MALVSDAPAPVYVMFHTRMALPSPPLDTNVAWVIARDLRAGTAKLTRCQCGYPTMLSQQYKRMLCPICQAPVQPGRTN